MSRVRTVLLVATLAFVASLRAESVRLLDDPGDAMQARVDVIQQATTDVSLLYFLARNDRITLGILALLRDAKRRGVPNVRVIVDGSFHRIPKAVLAHLGDEGIEVRVYHPFNPRHPSWMFRRMHEKVVLADSSRYITGGRNLAEAYFGLAKRKNYVDRDVFIAGESALAAQAYFEQLWSSRHVATLRVRVSDREKARASERLGNVLDELARSGFVALDARRDWTADAHEVAAVRFLRDPISPQDGPRVAVRLAEILESAEESIVIESPYFVPSTPLRALLRRKLAEGVSVTVVTNSLRSTDGLLPQAAYLKYRRRLAREGVAFREFKGPDALHAKSIVVDGRVALIGSYNIDPRSQYLNSEVLCVTENEEVARELLQSIAGHVENAWGIEHSERPRVSRSMALRLWGARLLLPIVEPQL